MIEFVAVLAGGTGVVAVKGGKVDRSVNDTSKDASEARAEAGSGIAGWASLALLI